MSRWLKVAVASLLLLAAAASAPRARAQDAATLQKQEAQAPLRFSKHALSRMDERGVSPQRVRQTIENGEAFKYLHNGRWEMGYYDASEKLFIATAHGLIITVITHASRHYVDGLKRKRP